VVGFEEGRIFSGYRFVFPLFCEDSHVGSVEISIGMDTALALLEEMNPDLNVFYLLDKDVVLNKVFDNQLDHYLPAFDFVDYLIDKAMFEKIIADEDHYNNITHPEILEQLGDVLSNENRTAESLLIDVDAIPHQVHLIPLNDTFDDPVGYFIAIKEASRESLISQRPLRELILYTVIYLLLLTLASVFIRDKLRLEELASKDQLTGVFNRHKLTELGQRELLRSKRTGGSVSALMLDIDHFKAVNDTFGHAQGDAVLKSLGKTLRETLRGVDAFGRWGGEEFLIIAPDTTVREALVMAERLRVAVATLENPISGPITVSIGIAATVQGEADLDLLVQRADEALYAAKETGRNKIVTWPFN
jgi:diguanylate cyclase (GGDEF)-like protein